ncbi:MAG: NAAT family transporter [Oligoflexia bacterium]|nr:NAAT family transporter [Oligoflexia bacterium]
MSEVGFGFSFGFGLEYILTVLITMITIVDPIGLVPVYLPIAGRFPKNKHNQIILRSIIIATIVSVFFLLAGKLLFKYLQISASSLYIAGGILLFLVGLEMIYARPSRSKSSPEEKEEAMALNDVSVFPLAIPMLAGPGTIATTIMFASRYDNWINYLVIFLALIISYLLAGFAMRFSYTLTKIFGQTGLNVLDRIMGIILCSLAVQFIINAMIEVFKIIR